MKFPQLSLSQDMRRPSCYGWLLVAIPLLVMLVTPRTMQRGALLIASCLLDVLHVDHVVAGDCFTTQQGMIRVALLGGGFPLLAALMGLAIFWGAAMNRPWIRRVALAAAAAALAVIAGAASHDPCRKPRLVEARSDPRRGASGLGERMLLRGGFVVVFDRPTAAVVA